MCEKLPTDLNLRYKNHCAGVCYKNKLESAARMEYMHPSAHVHTRAHGVDVLPADCITTYQQFKQLMCFLHKWHFSSLHHCPNAVG